MTDDRWRSFPIPICRGSQQDYSSFRKRLNLGQNWKWEFHNASTSIGKARNMGRNRRRSRCNDRRLRLGGLGNGWNSRKNGGDQRGGCFSPSPYAPVRSKGGAATGTACALEEGELLQSGRLRHQGRLGR